jgi:hypothetical protein
MRLTVVDEGPPKTYLIGDAEVEAATRFYEDYVYGIEGVRQPSLFLRSGAADARDVAIARALATGRHRDIAELLGPRITGWLVAFVVDDARRHGHHAVAAFAIVCVAGSTAEAGGLIRVSARATAGAQTLPSSR